VSFIIIFGTLSFPISASIPSGLRWERATASEWLPFPCTPTVRADRTMQSLHQSRASLDNTATTQPSRPRGCQTLQHATLVINAPPLYSVRSHVLVVFTARRYASQEIIFTDQRWKTKFSIPDKIPLLQRVQTIKILGVTFTSSLSVTLHVQSVIAACAQTLYALRVLRKHDFFRAVAVAKLMHPTPGGHSPMPTTDRRSLLSFVAAFAQPGRGFCSRDLADFHDLYISSGEKLFNKILTCPNHILRTLLPPPTAQNYTLRNRPHNRQLPDRISRITDCNFTVRMLYRPYRNMYWLLYILDLCFVYSCVQLRFDSSQ